MRKAHSGKERRRLLPRFRRRRVNHIAILPSLVTILNGVCGFVSIYLASRANDKGVADGTPYFVSAAYVVFLAMVFDMLDGRLARMSHSTSSFGGQLDSLCDMVSFGVAPAFLMLQIVSAKTEPIMPFSGGLLHRFIWVAALAYIACAAIRLARFNVENEESEAHHISFVGLPSPAAAGAIASLIIFQQEELPDIMPQLVKYVTYALPFLTVAVAVLMVSQVRYPHVLNAYLRGKKPFSYLIQAIFYGCLAAVGKWQVALVLVFWAFVVSGLAKSFWGHLVHHKEPASEDVQNVATSAGEDIRG
jgi:CDP-diacylglycerol--serine O-phosphatidyltransferase